MSNHISPAANVAFELPNMSLYGFTRTLILTGETGVEIATTLKAMQAAGMRRLYPLPLHLLRPIARRCVLCMVNRCALAASRDHGIVLQKLERGIAISA